ncbi:TraM recognition domain-containing protein [Sphingobium lactosutens]|uniref:TraD/TraG TraM recognition site domain-containing protein n=1 Tax=Sphingobium lactosutens DS20 TaxID=1331060 RepID=T0J4R0_9SPHN|nr:TraM recognition domain-containing protein [Sphingobium lactosutens]EQB16944.1 hypothetical protein RLDS_05780 [Sphingobium lactosutens DS20]
MHDLLDAPLLELPGGDFLCHRDLAQNVFVTGVTGGGKTSGPGRHLLEALLKSGDGGIVLCAKPTEAAEIRALCAKVGRLGSLIEWNGRNHGFNFLAYAMARMGQDGTNGLVEYLMRVVEMIRSASPMTGSNGDAFWLDALRVLLRYSVPVVYAATGSLSIASLIAFVRSAPVSPEQFHDPEWQRQEPFFMRCFVAATARMDAATCQQMAAYWQQDFARMDAKLRSNIIAGFMLLDRFNHGWLKDALCGATTISPALCFAGAIIVLDMSRAVLGDDGIIAQLIFKEAWQREVLGRNALPPIYRERFTFCYGDECQEFIASSDADFLAMSRSSRAATIYLTQALPQIYYKLGGPDAQHRAHSVIANLGIRFYCANNCVETNKWASEAIGKAVQYRHSHGQSSGSSSQFGMNMGEGTNWGFNSGSGGSSGYSSGSGGSSHSGGSSWSSGSSRGGSDSWGRNRGTSTNHGQNWGQNEVVDYLLEPGQFSRMLKTGGPRHGNRVSAILHVAGRRFAASGGNSMIVEFAQR